MIFRLCKTALILTFYFISQQAIGMNEQECTHITASPKISEKQEYLLKIKNGKKKIKKWWGANIYGSESIRMYMLETGILLLDIPDFKDLKGTISAEHVYVMGTENMPDMAEEELRENAKTEIGAKPKEKDLTKFLTIVANKVTPTDIIPATYELQPFKYEHEPFLKLNLNGVDVYQPETFFNINYFKEQARQQPQILPFQPPKNKNENIFRITPSGDFFPFLKNNLDKIRKSVDLLEKQLVGSERDTILQWKIKEFIPIRQDWTDYTFSRVNCFTATQREKSKGFFSEFFSSEEKHKAGADWSLEFVNTINSFKGLFEAFTSKLAQVPDKGSFAYIRWGHITLCIGQGSAYASYQEWLKEAFSKGAFCSKSKSAMEDKTALVMHDIYYENSLNQFVLMFNICMLKELIKMKGSFYCPLGSYLAFYTPIYNPMSIKQLTTPKIEKKDLNTNVSEIKKEKKKWWGADINGPETIRILMTAEGVLVLDIPDFTGLTGRISAEHIFILGTEQMPEIAETTETGSTPTSGKKDLTKYLTIVANKVTPADIIPHANGIQSFNERGTLSLRLRLNGVDVQQPQMISHQNPLKEKEVQKTQILSIQNPLHNQDRDIFRITPSGDFFPFLKDTLKKLKNNLNQLKGVKNYDIIQLEMPEIIEVPLWNSHYYPFSKVSCLRASPSQKEIISIENPTGFLEDLRIIGLLKSDGYLHKLCLEKREIKTEWNLESPTTIKIFGGWLEAFTDQLQFVSKDEKYGYFQWKDITLCLGQDEYSESYKKWLNDAFSNGTFSWTAKSIMENKMALVMHDIYYDETWKQCVLKFGICKLGALIKAKEDLYCPSNYHFVLFTKGT